MRIIGRGPLRPGSLLRIAVAAVVIWLFLAFTAGVTLVRIAFALPMLIWRAASGTDAAAKKD